jgi:hypothetical protein
MDVQEGGHVLRCLALGKEWTGVLLLVRRQCGRASEFGGFCITPRKGIFQRTRRQAKKAASDPGTPIEMLMTG